MWMIDTHCHLTSDQYQGKAKELVHSAQQAGVVRLVTIGVNIEDSRCVCALTQQYESVYGSVGVHPVDVTEQGVPTKELLLELAQSNKIVALGETGIDLYHGTNDSLAMQEESFLNHIEVAHNMQKAVVIHARNSFEQTKEVLAYAKKKFPNVQFLLHCFTGDTATAMYFIEHFGCFISFSGIVTFGRNAQEIQDAAKNIPLESIMCETDAPYLSPAPYRGKMNEPERVRYVYDYIADLRGLDRVVFIDAVERNVQRIFNW